MNLVLLHFGDRDYEIAEADDDWHLQRSVPVVWGYEEYEEDDYPYIGTTLSRLRSSQELSKRVLRSKGDEVVACIEKNKKGGHLELVEGYPHVLIACEFFQAIQTLNSI